MAGNTEPLIVQSDPAGIGKAVALLKAGKLVALPTETVYGLAARADSDLAVASVYRAKGRPDFNPLIVHVADVAAARKLAHMGEDAQRLAQHFWPGPLTLVLPHRADASLAAAVTAGLSTVALRSPAHPAMRAVLVESDLALAAPSANRSGAVSPTTADHVADSLGDRIDLIVDGGRCADGLESTIVVVRDNGDWQILRPGPISGAAIEAVLQRPEAQGQSPGTIEAPGQLASHYAPGKPMRLAAETAAADEFHIGFGGVAGDFNLSPSADLAEAAANLYVALHLAAKSAKTCIAVAPVPNEGIGSAISDRLRRAAA